MFRKAEEPGAIGRRNDPWRSPDRTVLRRIPSARRCRQKRETLGDEAGEPPAEERETCSSASSVAAARERAHSFTVLHVGPWRCAGFCAADDFFRILFATSRPRSSSASEGRGLRSWRPETEKTWAPRRATRPSPRRPDRGSAPGRGRPHRRELLCGRPLASTRSWNESARVGSSPSPRPGHGGFG